MPVVSIVLMVAGLFTVTYGLTSYDNSEQAPARSLTLITAGLAAFFLGAVLSDA